MPLFYYCRYCKSTDLDFWCPMWCRHNHVQSCDTSPLSELWVWLSLCGMLQSWGNSSLPSLIPQPRSPAETEHPPSPFPTATEACRTRSCSTRMIRFCRFLLINYETVCVCIWLVRVCVLPVSMRSGQAVGVHVPLWCGGDAVAVHGPDHGVCSSLQKQTDQLKVSYSKQTAESSLVA